MELVIASLNSHKVLELRELLKALSPSIQVLSLFDFPHYQKPEDEYTTSEEAATKKAQHAATTLQKVCLADHSGIVIPALQKKGSQSCHLNLKSTDTASHQTKTLLQEMSGLKELERAAFLECSLAVSSPNGFYKAITQRSEGFIAEEERGKITFEFDTIFIKHDYNKTLGELSPSVRNRSAHRRKALERLLPVIEKLA